MIRCPHTNEVLVEPSRYWSPEDAASRLTGTIITYHNKAIRVISVDHKIMTYILCENGDEFNDPVPQKVHVDSEYVDISSPPLGYINAGHRVYYARRYPKRRWKAGIDGGSVFLTPNGHSSEHSSSSLNNVSLKKIAAMIENVYPSVSSILKEATENIKKTEGAFHRKWSLGEIDRAERTAILYYKGAVAGHISWEGVLLPPKVTILEDFYHSAYVETLISAGLTVK